MCQWKRGEVATRNRIFIFDASDVIRRDARCIESLAIEITAARCIST